MGPDNSADYDLIPACTGEQWGFIDRTGKYVINPQYDNVTPFVEGRALVWRKEAVGYIDENGAPVTPTGYKAATPFVDGKAWTVLPNGAPTLIDTEGKTLFSLTEAETVSTYSDGLAVVVPTSGDTVRYIDETGKTLLTLTGYDATGSFHEGLATVERDGKQGYVDKTGKLVIALKFDRAGDFADGRAVVNENGKYGVIDAKGTYLITPQFDSMDADADRGYSVSVSDRYGYCDAKGKFTINPRFDGLAPAYGERLMLACQGELLGYVNREGEWAIHPQYTYALPFVQGLAVAAATDKKHGLIDEKGRWAVNPQFDGLYMLPAAMYPAYSVASDYFDVKGTARAILSFFEDGKVDGLPVGGCPLARFTEHYGLPSMSVEARRTLGPALSARIEVEGTFYKEVSDGWWDTMLTDDDQAPIRLFTVTFSLEGRGTGKGRDVYGELMKRLKADQGTIGGKSHYVVKATDKTITFQASAAPVAVGMNETVGYDSVAHE